MLKPLFEEQKHCIQCGNKVGSNHIVLAHQNYIDQQCLQFVQEAVSNGQIEEDMLLYYQYILSLVLNCQKCNNIIDGINRKRGNDVNFPPICTLCQPIRKQQQRPPQFCALCNKEMNDKVFKDMPIEVSGLVICHKCYSYQVKGMEETKEKQEKPDFGDFAPKKVFKEEKKQVKKQQIKRIPESKPEIKNLGLQIPRPQHKFNRKNSPLQKQSVKPQFLFNYNNPLKNPLQKARNEEVEQFDFPSEDVFAFDIAKKENKITCNICTKKFQLSEIKYREVNYDICKGCYQKNPVNKKQNKKVCDDEDDAWNLVQLFANFSTPCKNEVLPQQKKEQKSKKEEQKTPQIRYSSDNLNYDLKGCKICLNAKSTMINNSCRHLMMCDNCFKLMQSRHKARNDTMPCPYCSKVGKYTKYIEPIYI